jgi:hypothetical protein
MDERVAFFRIAAGAEDASPIVEKRSPMAAKSTAPKSAAPRIAAPKFTEPKFTEPKPIAPPASAPKPMVSDTGAKRANSGRAKGAVAPIVSRGPVARMQAAIVEALSDPEWKEF